MSKHAFVVAVSEYQTENNLLGVKEDVPTILPVLTNYGFNDVEVIQDEKATQENIIRGLNTLVKGRKPGDICIFYFSGHGFLLPKNFLGNNDPDGRDEALVPYEGVLSSLILDNWLGEFFENSIPDEVVFWGLYDSCYSGDISKNVFFPDEFEKTLQIEDIVMDAPPQFPQKNQSKNTKELIVDGTLKKVFHFGAAMEYEKALCKNIEGKSRSVFTWAIAEVLAGTPELTAQEFEEKVTHKVAEITRAHTPKLTAPPNFATEKIFS
ncbi:caspase family protein [Limnoraphis robusta Tam1]|uniref:caspase family protein n=1 Tax=Limnoraphis robusta TaxID=1118279 RepID=UPI002B217452|nr:caspase family protein [Limnoraphis robusta]MEA5540773.1 caspase family protein [Limnoraphis robusta Tam1]